MLPDSRIQMRRGALYGARRVPAPGQQNLFSGSSAGKQLDRGNRDFAFFCVRQAEGHGPHDLRMGQHGFFQFAGVNRVAT